MKEFDIADDMLFSIDRTIAEHGFAIQYVFGGDLRPPWAYTIGFTGCGWPEAVVVGVDPSSASGVIFKYRDAMAAGARPETGRRIDQPDIAEMTRLVDVDETYLDTRCDLLAHALAYYTAIGQARPPSAVQIVWGENGFFPWDADFDPKLRRLEPVFDVPGLPLSAGSGSAARRQLERERRRERRRQAGRRRCN